jgi:hypothetical protein
VRPIWRAVRFSLNGGDSRYSQPAGEAFNRALRRYMTESISDRERLLDGDFSEHFHRFSERAFLKRIHPYVFDMYNLPYRDFLYARIAGLVMESGQSVPQLKTAHSNPVCFREIADGRDACVVLALHTGFPHIVRLLASSGRSRITSILREPEFAESYFRTHGVPNPEEIRAVQADRNTLVKLESSAKDGHAICCNPDHINPATGKCDLISRAMFEFAARKRIPIYFFDYAVTDQGKLMVFSERAERSDNVDDAMEQFARFCFHSSGRRVTAIEKAH